MEEMWVPSIHWGILMLRAVLVYVFLLVLLRLTGKRQIGQLAPFDLVLLLVLSNAVQNGKFAANVTAGYSTGSVRWRNASKNPAEADMWLNETLASGMVPYFHFIGSEAGFCEDRRWQKVGAE